MSSFSGGGGIFPVFGAKDIEGCDHPDEDATLHYRQGLKIVFHDNF